MNHLEQIKQLKELLDAGAITEAEYEEQKRGILSQMTSSRSSQPTPAPSSSQPPASSVSGLGVG